MSKKLFWVLALLCSGCTSLTPGITLSIDVPSDAKVREGNEIPYSIEALTPELVARLIDEELASTLPDDDESLRNVPLHEYAVGRYDVIQITVWNHPELGLSVPVTDSPLPGEPPGSKATGHVVDSKGMIYFPYVGEIAVIGKPISQIRSELMEKLSAFIPDPQLDVRVSAYRSQRIMVVGEVNQPGTLPLTETPLRVIDAIAAAGGPTQNADIRNARLIRDKTMTRIDFADLYRLGNLRQNYLLQDGDVIQVPDTNKHKVYMLGEFQRPGTIYLRGKPLSLTEAMNKVDGLDDTTSNAREIMVFRVVDEERPSIYILNANLSEQLVLAAQFPMKPYDIVYAPSTSLAQWNRVIAQISPTIETITRLIQAEKSRITVENLQ